MCLFFKKSSELFGALPKVNVHGESHLAELLVLTLQLSQYGLYLHKTSLIIWAIVFLMQQNWLPKINKQMQM